MNKVTGDLNNDKIADVVLVLQYKDIVREVLPGGMEWEAKPRVLFVLLRDKLKPMYKLSLQNNYIITRAGMGKQGGDPYDAPIVKDGVLNLGDEWGGRYSFRFIDGDFFLVKAWKDGILHGREADPEMERVPDTSYVVYMECTKATATVTKILMDGGATDAPPSRKQYRLKPQPLLRLRDLVAFDDLKIFRGFLK